MKSQANESGLSKESISGRCSLTEYVEDMQRMIDGLLNTFYFQHKKLDELSYRRLSLETFEGNTIEEAENHFKRVLIAFKESGKSYLVERIRKGEQFIEQIGNEHPKYPAAVAKYEKLVAELGTFNE